jgi:radical SAM protein with 4Fe4S-binding SPASM domain
MYKDVSATDIRGCYQNFLYLKMSLRDISQSPLSQHRPARLLLQWHLSDRCNLRCTHCYQSSYQGEERGLADWHKLLLDYRGFLNIHHIKHGHINVTGGEPLALREFPAFMETLVKTRDYIGFGILSNGTLIDRAMARQLRKWGTHHVQVSIEGVRETHERIRGIGSFEAAIAGMEALISEGVACVISFTAQRSNWREFPAVAQLGRQLGVSRVWSDRLIPTGQADSAEVLSPNEAQEFFQLMRTQQQPRQIIWGKRNEVSMHRALQFIESDERAYRCTAGDTLVTVMPDGTLYPCRRLPIAVGNVYQTPLATLYQSALFQRLRDPAWVSTGCEHCTYQSICRGGLRCLTYAVTGDLKHADPGCWLAASPASASATTPAAIRT